MLVALDVHYGARAVVTAAIGWTTWSDAAACWERADTDAAPPAPYVPGAFALRELPYLVAMLARAPAPIELIVIDGYVWLGPDRPGLGAHLHAQAQVPVIGVAKTRFASATAMEVARGGSTRPLYVTAAGLPPAQAAAYIGAMHGPHRLPTLLKRVDGLARGHTVR